MFRQTAILMIIITFVLIVSGTFFTLKFSELDEEHYANIFLTTRTLLNYMVTNGFETEVNETDAYYEHSIFFLIFTFFTNMFFLNFLIALLTSVYKEMLEIGEYGYKSLKYKYYEKFKNISKNTDRM
jgi:hypothetical protein